jgi:hypothetical protein
MRVDVIKKFEIGVKMGDEILDVDDPLFFTKRWSQDDCLNSINNPLLFNMSTKSTRATYNFQTGLAIMVENYDCHNVLLI